MEENINNIDITAVSNFNINDLSFPTLLCSESDIRNLRFLAIKLLEVKRSIRKFLFVNNRYLIRIRMSLLRLNEGTQLTLKHSTS